MFESLHHHRRMNPSTTSAQNKFGCPCMSAHAANANATAALTDHAIRLMAFVDIKRLAGVAPATLQAAYAAGWVTGGEGIVGAHDATGGDANRRCGAGGVRVMDRYPVAGAPPNFR